MLTPWSETSSDRGQAVLMGNLLLVLARQFGSSGKKKDYAICSTIKFNQNSPNGERTHYLYKAPCLRPHLSCITSSPATIYNYNNYSHPPEFGSRYYLIGLPIITKFSPINCQIKLSQVKSRGRVESRQVKSIPSQVKLSQVNSN